MNNNKVIALVVGGLIALFALSLVLRFVLLNQAGVPGFFYLGLPIGGISVVILLLLRLGAVHLRPKAGRHDSTLAATQRRAGACAFAFLDQPPAPSVTQRLQELETLRATGAISETEYTAKRQQIISTL